jgi:hypothetical protein
MIRVCTSRKENVALKIGVSYELNVESEDVRLIEI